MFIEFYFIDFKPLILMTMTSEFNYLLFCGKKKNHNFWVWN